jgi:methylated-DNA-[protein]-cysteine S-methyltransferase
MIEINQPDAATIFYILISTPVGQVSVVWQEYHHRPQVKRIVLPTEDESAIQRTLAAYTCSQPASTRVISLLAEQIQESLGGQDVAFDLELLALDQCTPFQQKVLRAEYRIPRGMVSTYGRIAGFVGAPGGARAVGNALARNPFPLIIPCHRAIRSDGWLGGFQGGVSMKRSLLALEGIAVSEDGRVRAPRFWPDSEAGRD